MKVAFVFSLRCSFYKLNHNAYEKIICNIIILICCFWGISCTEENDLLEENVNALLETRSVPVIVTECRDAYVDVGNVVVYKGTTCQSYYVG